MILKWFFKFCKHKHILSSEARKVNIVLFFECFEGIVIFLGLFRFWWGWGLVSSKEEAKGKEPSPPPPVPVLTSPQAKAAITRESLRWTMTLPKLGQAEKGGVVFPPTPGSSVVFSPLISDKNPVFSCC